MAHGLVILVLDIYSFRESILFYVNLFFKMERLIAFYHQNFHEGLLMALGGGVGCLFAYFFGGNEEAIAWLMYTMAIDFALGTVCACRLGDWSSSACAHGLMKKFVVLVVCAISHGLDICAHTNFIQMSFISAFAFSEFGSIVETLTRLGYDDLIPEKLREFLAEAKKRPIKPL